MLTDVNIFTPAGQDEAVTIVDRPPARPYHHGRLAEALVEAGLELARAGGPGAVVLREAARRVGVSATAAYRHFEGQESLLAAVKQASLQVLADRLRSSVPPPDPTHSALQQVVDALEGIGRGYLQFASSEPGLFQCFCVGLPLPPGVRLDGGVPAFGVLSAVMNDLVGAGGLAPERRAGAEIAAWAAVHGLAVLSLDGVLAAHGVLDFDEMIQATFDMIVFGLLPR